MVVKRDVARFFFAAMLCFVSALAVSAELTAGDKERSAWVREKGKPIIKYSREVQEILKEMQAETVAAAPNPINGAPYKARIRKIDLEMVNYFETTSFDASNRFKDNPNCLAGIKEFEPVLSKLKQGSITGLDAGGNYTPMVLYRCGLSAKVFEVTKKLERLQADKRGGQ